MPGNHETSEDDTYKAKSCMCFQLPCFQYSIISLLGLTTVIAICLSYISHRAQQQRKAVAALSLVGAEFNYDWESNMEFCHTPPGPKWLRKLIGDEYFQNVTGVSFEGKGHVEHSSNGGSLSCNKSDDPFGSGEDDLQLTEEDLMRLTAFPKLQSLYIKMDCCALPLGFWKTVANLDSLHILSCGGGEVVNDENIIGINVLKNMQCLSLLSEAISDNRLKEIGKLQELRSLSLFCPGVTDQGLLYLKNLHNLRSLDLQCTKVKGPGLIYLPTSLESLNFEGTDISDSSIESLQKLRSLHTLNLCDTKVSDQGLRLTSQLHNLVELSLSGANITDRGLAYLKSLAKLSKLNLSQVTVSGRGIAELGDLPNLEHLAITSQNLNDKDLECFKNLKSVTHLSLTCPMVTEKGLIHLKKMPNLKSVMIWPGYFQDRQQRQRIENLLQGIAINWWEM